MRVDCLLLGRNYLHKSTSSHIFSAEFSHSHPRSTQRIIFVFPFFFSLDLLSGHNMRANKKMFPIQAFNIYGGMYRSTQRGAACTRYFFSLYLQGQPISRTYLRAKWGFGFHRTRCLHRPVSVSQSFSLCCVCVFQFSFLGRRSDNVYHAPITLLLGGFFSIYFYI